MIAIIILLTPFLLGLTRGQNPQCFFTLFLPEGCLVDMKDKQDYGVANFSFVSDAEASIKTSIPLDFCNKKDIWTTQDDGCVVFNDTLNFIEDIKCPQKNLILLSEGATFHPDATLRNIDAQSTQTSFRADSTGLLMYCEAEYPLNMTVDFDGPWPYLGISVAFGHFRLGATLNQNFNQLDPKDFSGEANASSSTKKKTSRRFWLKAKIPPKFSGREGNIQKYAGNYTVFSISEPNLNQTFQLQVKAGEGEIKVQDQSPCGHNISSFLEICQLQAHCDSSHIKGPGINVYLANIAGFNPTETRIMKNCLEKDSLCEGKVLGEICLDAPGCRLVEKLYQNGAVRCDDGQTVEDVFYFHGLDFTLYKNFSSSAFPTQSVIKLKEDDFKNVTKLEEIEEEEEDADFHNKTILVHHMEPRGFECQFIPYMILRPIDWLVTYVNGSESLVHQSTEEEERVETLDADGVDLYFQSVFLNLKMTKDIRSLACHASSWNSAQFFHSNIISFNVQESEPPKFLVPKRPTETVEFGQKLKLSCGNATGQPEPTYTWKINNVQVNKSDSCVKTKGRSIEICAAGPEYDGKFTCIASNFHSSTFQDIPVQVQKSRGAGSTAWIYFGVACGIILILIPILVLLFRVYSRTRRRLTYLEIEAFENGNIKELQNDKFAHENAQFLPYNKDYEIPSTNFEIDEDQVLGRGAYGIVMKAKINGSTTAAVKTVLPDADKATVFSLLSELKIMIYLGKHSHVVELLGANTEQLKNGCPFIFVEFCQLGNLESFIKKNRDDFIARRKRGEDVGLSYANVKPGLAVRAGTGENNDEHYEMNTEDFFRWSIQISDGMAYLQEKKVIHGDLAIRNVLLTRVDHVKITDFGLSRQLLNSSAYVKKQQQLLPWRHMALESLQSLIFTSKSDVWSFGVTMYEIFSLGQIPYGGMSWTVEFVEKLEANLRCPMPAYGNLELYGIMLECWNPVAEYRPDFVELGVKLKALLKQLLKNTNTNKNSNSNTNRNST